MVIFSFKPTVTLTSGDDTIVDSIKSVVVSSHTLGSSFVNSIGNRESSINQFIREMANSSATNITGYSNLQVVEPVKYEGPWRGLTYEMIVSIRGGSNINMLSIGIVNFATSENWLQILKDKLNNIQVTLTDIDEIIFREVLVRTSLADE